MAFQNFSSNKILGVGVTPFVNDLMQETITNLITETLINDLRNRIKGGVTDQDVSEVLKEFSSLFQFTLKECLSPIEIEHDLAKDGYVAKFSFFIPQETLQAMKDLP